MTALDRAFWNMSMKSEKDVRMIAADGHGLQQLCARMILTALDEANFTEDFPGQKREKNGRFGAGKMAKSEAGVSPKQPAHHSEKEIKEYLSGNPQINSADVEKHIYGSPAYEKAVRERKKAGENPPSFFRQEDAEAVKAEVIEKIKSGDYAFKDTKSGENRVLINIESAKGIAYNTRGRKQKTSLVEVAVSLKKGFHWFAIPAEEESQ